MAGTGIAFYRARKGLKQAELATELGTPESRMSRLENGVEIPTAEDVDKLVRILEVPPTFLFSRRILEEIAERARVGDVT